MDTKALVDWFQKHQRPLDWRKHRAPYTVLVSELMLQQTQVNTVIPYFKKWMKRYPNLECLAEASEEEVLKLWQGLGYYSRARNLLKTAQTLVLEKRPIPEDYQELVKLPGIGDYTANAILAFAFNKDVCVLDGNIERVVARLHAVEENVKLTKTRNFIKSLMEQSIPKGQSALYNEALMELGATICAPSSPSCSSCPLQTSCQSLRLNKLREIPLILKKKPLKKLYRIIRIVKNGDEILMRQIKDKTLYYGLWEVYYEEFENEADLKKIIKTMSGSWNIFTHRYTQFKILCYVSNTPFNDNLEIKGHWQWVSLKDVAKKLPITSLSQKALRHL